MLPAKSAKELALTHSLRDTVSTVVQDYYDM